MGAQWRGVVWHTTGYDFQFKVLQWMVVCAWLCATRSPVTQAMAARRAQQKKAAGGLNLAEMNGAMNDGMEPSEQNLWLIIYGYTIL